MLLQATTGIRGVVYDLETGRRVPKVFELNTERGYLKAYSVVAQNDTHPEQEVVRRNQAGEAMWYEAVGKFRLVSVAPGALGAVSSPTKLGAPFCSLCRSPLTLSGDDLCPRCRAAERGQQNRFLVERLTTPLFNRKCQSCSRTAAWAVSDEVEVSPEVSNRKLWDRGMTVGRRYYCAGCYRPARLLDPRGEVVGDCAYAGPDLLPSPP